MVKITEYDFVSAFDLNSVDGTLKVARLIDREKVELIKLQLKVEDIAATKSKQVSSGKLSHRKIKNSYHKYFKQHVPNRLFSHLQPF